MTLSTRPNSSQALPGAILYDGGEMGGRIRTFPWEETIGSLETWPSVLVTVVNLMLQSPVPLVLLWGDEGIMLYNDAYSVFAKGRHPSLLGCKVLQGWPEVAEFNQNVMRQVMQGQTLSYQDQQLTLFRDRESEEVWMDLNYSPILAEGGKPMGVLAIVQETTQRILAQKRQRQAEEALAYQSRLTSTITQNASLALFMMDAQGRTVFMNPAAERMCGYTFQEAQGQVLHDLVHRSKPDGSPFPMEECPIGQTVFTLGHLQNHEDVFNRKDGSFIPVLCSASAIWEKDRLTGVILEVQDITQGKQAEAELSESEERFRMMSDSAPMLIAMANVQLGAEYFNKAWLEYTGLPVDALLGNGWAALLHPEDGSSCFKEGTELPVLRSRMTTEFRLRRHDGVYRWFMHTTSPRFDLDENVIGYIGCSVDITEIKNAQEALKVYAWRLEQSNRDLEQFAYIASHDMKEPLRKIQMFSSMLAADDGENIPYYTERLQKVAERMRTLIDDLLALSQVNRKAKPLVKTSLKLVIEDVLDDLQVVIAERQAEIKADLRCHVMGDAQQLHQVLQNLVSNALKFQQPGTVPQVKVTSRAQGELCEVTVEDNGIGFDEAQSERIFIPFERLHGKTEYEGTGIGLAIVKKIVERHGGRIEAHGERGKGSRFVFTIPLAPG